MSQTELYASSVCDMNSAKAAAVCDVWRYCIQVLHAFAFNLLRAV